MSFVAFEVLNFLIQLITIGVESFLLFFHTLSILVFQLLDHLRMSLLGVRLVVKVHFLLELK